MNPVHPISGIQQIGVGVKDATEAWKWYRKWFGMDICVFEDTASAKLMTQYTGDQVQDRHAVLALNMQSGGGFEIWQFTSREPQPATFEIKAGDLGVYAAKIKCKNVPAAFKRFQEGGYTIDSSVQKDPAGNEGFFVKDPYGNLWHIVNGDGWYQEEQKLTGGIYGAVIGVSNMDRALDLYSKVLGYSEVVSDTSGEQADLSALPGGTKRFRRVILRCPQSRSGAFSRLLGPAHIELWQALDSPGRKIFEQRYWGDLGFIHLCFDVVSMKRLGKSLHEHGFKFTVDSSNSFDMGEAAGHFTYTEDPDQTLIEFVETHRVPIMKKIGWFLNLHEKRRSKPLPNWMVRSLRFNRVKD